MEQRRDEGSKASEVNKEHITVLESKIVTLNQQIDILNTQIRNESQSSKIIRD
jgi:hypothetical protein